jgi:fructose/tagatose bisphosphate aldolase
MINTNTQPVEAAKDDLIVDEANARYAIPEECERLVHETKVDSFSPVLGSVHGLYRGKPKLGFDRMEQIQRWLDIIRKESETFDNESKSPKHP